MSTPDAAAADDARHPFGTCAHCGAAFEPDVTYPVETRRSGDGALELYSFCDDGCRAAWAGGR